MSEEIDKHVLRKYEVQQKLGKGVRAPRPAPPLPRARPARREGRWEHLALLLQLRLDPPPWREATAWTLRLRPLRPLRPRRRPGLRHGKTREDPAGGAAARRRSAALPGRCGKDVGAHLLREGASLGPDPWPEPSACPRTAPTGR